jgi:hypothetical protein
MENILKFNGDPVLIKMSNNKQLSVWFIPDKKDNFLINVIYFRTGTGTINYETIIIESDYKTRVNRCKQGGYLEIKNKV